LIIASETQYDPQVVQCFIPIAQSEMAPEFAATGTSTTVVLWNSNQVGGHLLRLLIKCDAPMLRQ